MYNHTLSQISKWQILCSYMIVYFHQNKKKRNNNNNNKKRKSHKSAASVVLGCSISTSTEKMLDGLSWLTVSKGFPQTWPHCSTVPVTVSSCTPTSRRYNSTIIHLPLYQLYFSHSFKTSPKLWSKTHILPKCILCSVVLHWIWMFFSFNIKYCFSIYINTHKY